MRVLPKLKESGCTDVSQPEISAYAELLTDHAGVRDSIVFERKVTRLRYIGRGAAVWEVSTVDTATGEPTDVVTCTHVVAANGPLSSPRLPEFDGMDEFQGESFHTAQWDQSASLAGKRVGVIGTGASAAQVITTIADEVEELLVFQRTPTWCVPRNDEPTPDDMRAQFEAGEGYAEALRKVDWEEDPDAASGGEDIDFGALHDPEANAKICAGIAMGIKMQVHDPELAATLTPDYVRTRQTLPLRLASRTCVCSPSSASGRCSSTITTRPSTRTTSRSSMTTVVWSEWTAPGSLSRAASTTTLT